MQINSSWPAVVDLARGLTSTHIRIMTEIEFDITESEAIKRISKALNWYRDNSTTAKINRLLEFQDKLSVLTVQLARIAARKKGLYLTAYFKRKLTIS